MAKMPLLTNQIRNKFSDSRSRDMSSRDEHRQERT